MTRGSPALGAVPKFGWAFGQFALASHMAIVSIYLMYYLTEGHGVSASLAGLVLLLPRVWNVVTDPLMGAISDRTRSRWGRRRPYLLAGALLWGAAFAAMFALPVRADPTVTALWFVAIYLAVNTGVTLYHVPYSAMAPEMTRDYDERLKLIGYKEMAARIAVLLAIAGAPLLLEAAGTPAQGYRWIGLAFGGLILVSGVVAFFATARAPAVDFQPQTMRLREQWETLKRNRPLGVLALAYLFGNMGSVAFSALLIYFITVVHGQSPALMGVLYPVGALTSVVLTPVWARIGARIGKREACRIAYLGLILCWLSPGLVPPGAVWALYLLMVAHGAFNAAAELLPNAMVPDTVEYDELNSGARREGTIYGAWIFVQQTGMALGGFVASLALVVLGYQAGAEQHPESVVTGLRWGFAALPAASLLVAWWLVGRYDLSAARFAQIQRELAARRATTPSARTPPVPEDPAR
ncbi:MFS transporter [Luteimonas huabeiensis]|uniref:MFS transporter n=1 Tax=Luteimonas huabeiensis TaxID=1244513 RepID=UPI000466B2CE|nr:MFS transporter [Luteimonas huabeiensis]